MSKKEMLTMKIVTALSMISMFVTYLVASYNNQVNAVNSIYVYLCMIEFFTPILTLSVLCSISINKGSKEITRAWDNFGRVIERLEKRDV